MNYVALRQQSFVTTEVDGREDYNGNKRHHIRCSLELEDVRAGATQHTLAKHFTLLEVVARSFDFHEKKTF